jgi:outer membrane lipoprotein SlyB
MKTPRILALLLAGALVLPACVTTSVTRTNWGDPPADEWVRYGRVESIQEVVRRQEGNPGAGAVAGAIVGGLLGSAIGGHTHYDRWGYAHTQGSGTGAVVGAVGGAMVGAAASQGSSEQRRFEVFVRFEDGGVERFVFPGPPPHRVGDAVSLTARGLVAG